MPLADFIEQHAEAILQEAERFTASLLPAAGHLDSKAMRDHLPVMLDAIVADLRTAQTPEEQSAKSMGRGRVIADAPDSAAEMHAVGRAKDGFDIDQVVAEYRALRASVLRLWRPAEGSNDLAILEEVTRFNEALDQAIAESVAAFSIETERWRHVFLAVLGHDLRGPLNAVLLTAELLSRMQADGPVTRHMQGLVRSGRRMQQLLDSLLDYSRTSLGSGINVTLADADLAGACQEEIDVLRAALPGRAIELMVVGVCTGNYDASRFREILSNLVFNAAKYSPPDSVIQVRLTGDPDDLVLAVENAGTIAHDSLHSLFEPLRRGGMESSEAQSERTSMGLGLFIVQEIAKSHGGRVEAASENGRTTFTVTLPTRS